MWFASEVMELVAYSSVSFYHQSCDVCNHYREPTQYFWVCHPADELVQLTISYASDLKNMILISSVQWFHHNRNVRTCEIFLFHQSLACVLSSISSGLQQILQMMIFIWRPDLQKWLVWFLHHPHLKGWQSIHHPASTIWERWHWSQCTSLNSRGLKYSNEYAEILLEDLWT